MTRPMTKTTLAIVLLALVGGDLARGAEPAKAPASRPVPADVEAGLSAIGARRYADAMRLLRPQADQGQALAQNGVGVLYMNGWGVKQDFKQALEWFRLSADQGEPRGQFNLGRMCENGQGMARDPAAAARYYRLAADQNYAPAASLLASLYARGEGLTKDYAQAMQWYRRAADQEDPIAQASIAYMYMEGEGVAKDPGEAVKWLEKSAAHDWSASMLALARYYSEGATGVPKDHVRALMWLRRSAVQGNEEAVRMLRDRYQTRPDQGPAIATVEQAMQADPRALAESYLAVTYMRALLESARSGSFHATVISTLDGRKETIKEGNALLYLAGYEDRARIYRIAIEKRGSRSIAGDYDTRPSAQCDALVFSGESHLVQEGFELGWSQGDSKNTSRHRGVVVGDSVAFEHAADPEIVFTGHAGAGRIDLIHSPTKCEVALTSPVKPSN